MSLGIKIALQKNTVYGALKISLLVGIAINFINQSEAIISLQIDQLDSLKVGLTFLIPYLVSTYSTTKVVLRFKIGEPAPADIKVHCHNCGTSSAELIKGNKIPVCPNCVANTRWKI